MDREALLSELRQRNRERLPRLIDIERRAREGYAISRQDREDRLDGMESASSSLARADSDPCEIVIARRIRLLCESIGLLTVANHQRRHKARFQTARG